jgi:hypothetical protein
MRRVWHMAKADEQGKDFKFSRRQWPMINLPTFQTFPGVAEKTLAIMS